MSWFGTTPATGPQLHPVDAQFPQEALFGTLVKEDTEWLCAGGFITETQTFYASTATGGLVMCQVVHSSIGLWYPTIQFTFRYVEPSKDIHIWKSTAVTSFVSAPSAALDKRSCKSDQFSITLDPATPNRYTIEGKYDADVQISLVYEKLADGWKLGAGPRGGMTYFGTLAAQPPKGPAPDLTSGADGYAIHRFWPRCAVSGIMRVGTDVVDLVDARGIFVHAVQGMRPNILAAKWNFANFQSSAAGGQGVSLTMMEFTTTPAYGSQTINVGSVVVGDKLVAVTAGSALAGVGSHAKHLASVLDAETEYEAPGQIAYAWEGQTLGEAGKSTNATLLLDLATSAPGAPYTTRGLVEKVDVLGQIPYLLKKFVNYAAGTKPYIYTWLNEASATVDGATVPGVLFNEATFIS